MSSIDKPFEVRVDPVRNILFLTLNGFLSAEQVKSASDDVIRKVKLLRPGFAVVNDISTFKPVSPEATAHVTVAQQAIAAAGVGRVVRIVGDGSKLTGMQFSRTARAAGYDADSAATVEDAVALITGAAARK